MTENELQQAFEILKDSYNYHDRRPQTQRGQEMLKQDEEHFIDEALLPYLKQIAEKFTSDLRNTETLQLKIISNGGGIVAERVSQKNTNNVTRRSQTSFSPRHNVLGLKILLPDGNIIQETNGTETFCAAIEYAISRLGIDFVLDAMEKFSITCDGEPLLKREPHRNPISDTKPIGNNCFVNTHMSTPAKKLKLEKIGYALNIHWEVFII